MEGDRLSGGIAPLFFKFDSRRMRVVRLCILATVLLQIKPEFAGWVLHLMWMFWRKDLNP